MPSAFELVGITLALQQPASSCHVPQSKLAGCSQTQVPLGRMVLYQYPHERRTFWPDILRCRTPKGRIPLTDIRRSFLGDLWLLLKTIPAIISGRGAY